ARDYGQLGGRTLIAGKPFAPIYAAALNAAAEVLGREVKRSATLAVGDGILTDIKGAGDAGIDALFIAGGIHAGEYAGAAGPEAGRLSQFLAAHGHLPVAYMPHLR